MLKLAKSIALVAVVSVAPVGPVEAESLAKAAEQFAQNTLSLPSGSVHAHSVDPRVKLGECATGWVWSFPYQSKSTVKVYCKGPGSAPEQARYVLLTIDSAHSVGESHSEQPASSGRDFIVVASRELPIGHVLGSDDLTLGPTSGSRKGGLGGISDVTLVLGQALTRSIRRGEPVGMADARPIVIVRRNTIVSGWTEFPGGRVFAKLLALQDGKSGDWINLENPQSNRKLRGEVQRDGSVRLGGRPDSQVSLVVTKDVGSTAD